MKKIIVLLALFMFTSSAWAADPIKMSDVLGLTDNAVTYDGLQTIAFSSEKFIIIYRHAADSDNVKVALYILSGGNWGLSDTEYLVSGGSQCQFLSGARLTSSSIIVAFSDIDDSYYGKTCIITESGGALTVASPTTFLAETTNYCAVSRLTDTTAAIVYQQQSSGPQGGKIIKATVSGTSISVSSPTAWGDGRYKQDFACAGLSSDAVFVSYTDGTDSGKKKVALFNFSGSTWSFTQVKSLTDSGDNYYVSPIVRLSDTTAIVAYRDKGDSNKGKTVIVSYSGSTISLGTPIYLLSGGTATNKLSIAYLKSTEFIISFSDGADSNKGKAILCTNTTGTTLVANETAIYFQASPTDSYHTSSSGLDEKKAVIAFCDTANSYRGKFVIADTTQGYPYKINGVIPKKIYGVIPKKVNGI